MSARCCSAATLGLPHSANCMGAVYTPTERQIDTDLHEIAKRETWKAERARNLREQRRYEIARDLFTATLGRYGTSASTEQVSRAARGSIIDADLFLEELARVPE